MNRIDRIDRIERACSISFSPSGEKVGMRGRKSWKLNPDYDD